MSSVNPSIPAVLVTRSINTTAPLSGGGDLSADRTIALTGPFSGGTSFTAHGVLIGEGTAPVAATAPGTAGQVLTSNGPNADPSFQAGGGNLTLAQVLANGNTTGTTPIVVSDNEVITSSPTTDLQLTAGKNVAIGVTAGNAISLTIGASVAVLVDGSRNVILNDSGSALATAATGGFTHLPTCAGPPTGMPAVQSTGATPSVVDSNDSTINVYDIVGSQWRVAGVAKFGQLTGTQGSQTLCTLTPPAVGIYEVSGCLDITIAGGAVSLQVVYSSVGSATITTKLPLWNGTATANSQTNQGTYAAFSMQLFVNSSPSAITVSVVDAGALGTWNACGTIKRLA